MIKVVSKTAEQALDEVGLRGVDIVKKNTVSDTGRLRGSMGYSISGKVVAVEAFEDGDKIKKNSSKKDVVVGTNVKYAPYVEYLAKNGSQGYFL